jgi:hypothetical protein
MLLDTTKTSHLGSGHHYYDFSDYMYVYSYLYHLRTLQSEILL